MKAVFKRADLSMATSVVHNVVNQQSSLPILSNILIRAEESRAVFLASDLESYVRCEVPAEVEAKGEVTVPARTLAEMVRVLPDADIVLAIEEDRVRVSAEGLSYDLVSMDPADFPAWPELKPMATIELSQQVLLRIIERILFAIPQKDPRRVLLGGYFDVQDRTLKAVSTDGKKLSFVQTEADSRTGEEAISAVVPQKVLSEIAKTLGDEGNVEIHFGERQVAFDLKNVKYISNIIEGNYPNYDLVIPKTFERTMALPRERLRALTRQASIISDEKSNSVVLTFADNQLRVKAMTYDIGSYAGALPIQYDQETFEIVFNHRFLGEILDKIEGEEVMLKANKPVSPAVFTGKDATDFLFVIMPIKLADLAEAGTEEEAK
jgi:DNA polymerase-3 subunit beta